MGRFKIKGGNKMKKKYYSLFEGRHELPENEGAVFSEFDFETFTPKFTEVGCWVIAGRNTEHNVYVTGLTPALCFLIEKFVEINKFQKLNSKLVLWHYDRDTNSYRISGVF